LDQNIAFIQNKYVRIEYNLTTGLFKGINVPDGSEGIPDAYTQIDDNEDGKKAMFTMSYVVSGKLRLGVGRVQEFITR
jgi:hypothetical protein